MESEERKSGKNDYLLPAAIVIAALVIAGAWIYSTGKNASPASNAKNTASVETATNPGAQPDITIKMKPVDPATDHIRGNIAAPVKIVEYSDLECPFCKMFHRPMLEVMDTYGKTGQVAWVYRHYPIAALHSKAEKSAEAAECANELGGNIAFWAFVDKYFQTTPSNNQIDLSTLPGLAASINLDKTKFQNCWDSGKYSEKIKASIEDAQNAGAQGTPYSVVISSSGNKYPITGAVPFDRIKTVIDQALRS